MALPASGGVTNWYRGRAESCCCRTEKFVGGVDNFKGFTDICGGFASKGGKLHLSDLTRLSLGGGQGRGEGGAV